MAQFNLHLKLEHDASILKDFYSGVDALDTFIHTRLSAFLRAYNCRFYVLRNEQGVIVAMFVISGAKICRSFWKKHLQKPQKHAKIPIRELCFLAHANDVQFRPKHLLPGS